MIPVSGCFAIGLGFRFVEIRGPGIYLHAGTRFPLSRIHIQYAEKSRVQKQRDDTQAGADIKI